MPRNLFPWITCLALFSGHSAHAEGTLKLFRWNLGFKAENTALAEITLSEEEYQEFMRLGQTEKLKRKAYSGCFLTQFSKNPERTPASNTRPISSSAKNLANSSPMETRRICIAIKSKPADRFQPINRSAD